MWMGRAQRIARQGGGRYLQLDDTSESAALYADMMRHKCTRGSKGVVHMKKDLHQKSRQEEGKIRAGFVRERNGGGVPFTVSTRSSTSLS